MKIFSSQQSKSLDAATIANEPISSLNLMERAGHNITQQLLQDYGKAKRYVVLCGNGNNGGDGLVIARHLILEGCDVKVFYETHSEKKSEENQVNLDKLKKLTSALFNFEELTETKNTIWIDALLGSGLSRPLTGIGASVVDIVNKYEGDKVAIDIPSGLASNVIPAEENKVFYADKTYSIGQPKLTFFFPESGKYVGEFSIVDINLDQEYKENLYTSYYYTRTADIQKIYRPRKRFSHKGTYGHAMIIGGSYGKIGASIMATEAAMRAGAGLVTSYVPSCGYEILQSSIPEAMCMTDKEERYIKDFPEITDFNSIGIGCGLGNNKKTKDAFFTWLKSTDFTKKGLVLDADALNLLSEDKKQLLNLPKNAILTPHPKEFDRLSEETDNSLDRLEIAREFAQQYEVVIVLKDAYTAIVDTKGDVTFNPTGNAGLSTGGSGDCLTGIITALLAQGYDPLEAAKLGVWLHGKSADIGIEQESMESFTATDINTYLGSAFKSLHIK